MKIFNKKVRFNYHILDSVEAGVVLSGAEVKAVRGGRVDLSESFARIFKGEVLLKNMYIHPFQGQSTPDDPKKDRKLLLHRKQIADLQARSSQSAMALIPLSLYTAHNLIKVELGVVASKKKFDKRRAIKERDQLRKIEQEMSLGE